TKSERAYRRTVRGETRIPEQPEAFSMPSNERVRLHDSEDSRPVDQPRQPTSAMRVASPARRGLTCRSRYSANCFHRNKFSAPSCACERHTDEPNRRTSAATRRNVRTKTRERDWLIGHDGTPRRYAAAYRLHIEVQQDPSAAGFLDLLRDFARIEFCGPQQA